MHTLHVAGDIRIDKLEMMSSSEIFTGTLRVRTESCRRYRGDDHVLRVNVKLPTNSDFDDDPDDPDDYGLFVGADNDPALCVGGCCHRLKVKAPTPESPKVGRGMSMSWIDQMVSDITHDVLMSIRRNK